MAQVFVSCSSEDRELAERFLVDLETHGIRAWFYGRDSRAGASYFENTANAIDRCSSMIVLVSRASTRSRHMTNEIARAFEEGKQILPILIDLEHEELAAAQPEWRQAFGPATSIRWRDGDHAGVISSILDAVLAQADAAVTVASGKIRLVWDGDFQRPSGERRRHLVLQARALLARRATDLRVAFSTAIRISRGDRYLLVNNLHRPESFAPFGGVYKHKAEARAYLDSIGFRPQSIVDSEEDMYMDLRGFLPLRNGSRIVQWFFTESDRETGEECLARELEEELDEAGIIDRISLPDTARVRHLRRVIEPVSRVAGESFLQYRIFDVFDFDDDSTQVQDMIAALFDEAPGTEKLRVVTYDDIRTGRTRGGTIGHHAAYLIGDHRFRPDDPMFRIEGN